MTSVDARNTTDLAAFKGTDYQRPEDMQLQTVNGREYLYVTTTTTNEVYRLALGSNTISVFTNRATTDLATGAPVGSAFTSPDNLAIDHDGNITSSRTAVEGRRRHLVRQRPQRRRRPHRRRRGNRSLGLQRHRGLGIHRPLLRPRRTSVGRGSTSNTPTATTTAPSRSRFPDRHTSINDVHTHTRESRVCLRRLGTRVPCRHNAAHPNCGAGVRQLTRCPTGAEP